MYHMESPHIWALQLMYAWSFNGLCSFATWWMTLLSMTVIPHNMPHMTENFCKNVPRKRSPKQSQVQVLWASGTGYQIDHTITDAISKFPTSANHTDLQSLVNQMPASLSIISSLLTLLHPLFSTKNDFQWSATHAQAFQTGKQPLTNASMLSFLL